MLDLLLEFEAAAATAGGLGYLVIICVRTHSAQAGQKSGAAQHFGVNRPFIVRWRSLGGSSFCHQVVAEDGPRAAKLAENTWSECIGPGWEVERVDAA